MDVGAGYIHLQYRGIRFLVYTLAHVRVLVDAEAADVRDDRAGIDGAQSRHLVADDLIHTRVLQPHGIQHAGAAALRYPR